MGEPECAILFRGLGRKSILPADVSSKAGYHEFNVVSLTPSVALVVDLNWRDNLDEEEKLVNLYKGRAHVYLKESIFQPSNA